MHFLSPDPLGHAACMYLYSYASGDPVNSVDPDGRFGKSAASQVWGGIKSTAQFGVSLLGAYAWEATSYLGEDAAKPFEQSFVAANSVVPNAVQNYQDNLAIQGSHAGAINATFNPMVGVGINLYEAVNGVVLHSSNFGQDLSCQQRVDSAAGAALQFAGTALAIDGAVGGFIKLGGFRTNMFGEGEAAGFVDASSNVRFANGRPLTSTFADKSASDIFIRSSPITGENTLSEIVRLSRPVTRITLLQAAEGFQGQSFIDAFGSKATVNFNRTFTSKSIAPGVDMRIMRLTIGGN